MNGKSVCFNFFLIVSIALSFRVLLLLTFPFDGLYGQDSYAYLDWSKQFADAIFHFQVPPNFYWPIGYYFFTTIFSLLTVGDFTLAALLVSIFSSSLCAGVVYLIALRLFENEPAKSPIAFASGLLMCFSGAIVKPGLTIMSDALGLLFLCSSVYFVLKYCSEKKLSAIIYAFIFLSLGTMTRYADALIALVIVGVLFYDFFKSQMKSSDIKKITIAGLIGLIIFLPQLYYIFKYGIAYLQPTGETRVWATGWSPINYFKKDFITLDGTQHYKFPNGLYFISPIVHPLYLSVFGITFFSGLYFLVRKKLFVPLIILVSWIAVYYFYLAGNPFQSLRYTQSFFPALAIISAFGLYSFKFNCKIKKVFLCIGLFLMIGYGTVHFSGFVSQKNDDLKIAVWIDNNISNSSLVFSFEVTGTLNNYSKRKIEEFYLYDGSKLKEKIDSSSVEIYFVLPVEKLRTQWKSLPIEKTFDYLSANFKVTEVSKINHYTIFKLVK